MLGGFAGTKELGEARIFFVGLLLIRSWMELLNLVQALLVGLGSGVRDSQGLGGGVENVEVGQVELACQDLVVGMALGDGGEDGAGFRTELF